MPQISPLGDPGHERAPSATLVIAPKHLARHHSRFDLIELGHQRGEQRLACVVEQRPPSLLPILGVDDLDTVRMLLWPVVGNLERAEDVLLALQSLPAEESGGRNRTITHLVRLSTEGDEFHPCGGWRLSCCSVWRTSFQAHARERIDGWDILLPSAVADEPGSPTGDHGGVRKTWTFAMNDIAVLVSFFNNEQLCIDGVDQAFRELTDLP